MPYPKNRRLMVLDGILPGGLPVPRSFEGTTALHLPTLKTHGLVGLAVGLDSGVTEIGDGVEDSLE